MYVVYSMYMQSRPIHGLRVSGRVGESSKSASMGAISRAASLQFSPGHGTTVNHHTTTTATSRCCLADPALLS